MMAPSFQVAEVLGERIIESVDRLVKYAPKMLVTLSPIELDGVAFEITIRLLTPTHQGEGDPDRE